MMHAESIGIGALEQALFSTYEKFGSRSVILDALRSGAIKATCDEFFGQSASAFSPVPYPDQAKSYELPTHFWGYDWHHDGERICAPNSRDHSSLVTDWASGSFVSISTWGGRQNQQIRRASGVKVSRDDAFKLLASHGLSSLASSATNSQAAESEVRAWCLLWLKKSKNSEEAWAAFQNTSLKMKREGFRQIFGEEKRRNP